MKDKKKKEPVITFGGLEPGEEKEEDLEEIEQPDDLGLHPAELEEEIHVQKQELESKRERDVKIQTKNLPHRLKERK